MPCQVYIAFKPDHREICLLNCESLCEPYVLSISVRYVLEPHKNVRKSSDTTRNGAAVMPSPQVDAFVLPL